MSGVSTTRGAAMPVERVLVIAPLVILVVWLASRLA